MENTKSILQRHSAKFKDADNLTKRGYVQMPRIVLYSNTLSDGDKITHLLLLSFAWKQPSCFPAQATLGNMRGKQPRQLRRNLKSLSDNGYINIIQNGSARPNRYEILCRVANGGQIIVPSYEGDVGNIEFEGADDFSIGGFVQVPVAMLENKDLKDGSILTYAIIADQGMRCPSQEDMADTRGITRSAFSSHVSELVKYGYLDIRKEGWGSNLTYIRKFQFNKQPN